MANRRVNDANAQMRAAFPDDDGTEIRLAEEVVTLVEQYDAYQRMESEAKALKDECMVSLMALMGTHKTGIVKDWLITWATSFKKEFVMPAVKSRRFSVRRIG
jgi:hypothetical protein